MQIQAKYATSQRSTKKTFIKNISSSLIIFPSEGARVCHTVAGYGVECFPEVVETKPEKEQNRLAIKKYFLFY